MTGAAVFEADYRKLLADSIALESRIDELEQEAAGLRQELAELRQLADQMQQGRRKDRW